MSGFSKEPTRSIGLAGGVGGYKAKEKPALISSSPGDFIVLVPQE